MSRLVEQGVVALVGAIGVAYAVFPAEVGAALSPAASVLVEGITWTSEQLPRPAFLLLILAVLTVTTVLFAIALARACYPLLQYAGPRTKRAYGFVTPDTPLGKMATGIMLLMAVVFGSIWGLPAAIGSLEDNSSVSQADDLAERATDLDPISFSQQDVLAGTSPSGESSDAAAYDRPTPDADGDRLKDSWEEAGETPGGVPLPDADPERMDLYVQFNYGDGTIPLSDREKRQLREVWSNMPVDNPDGSQGIDIHITERPQNGLVGERVTISGNEYSEIHQYYTRRYMGQRMCRYQQVVFGSIDRPEVGGIATIPGYAAVVEGHRREHETELEPRVVVITHELLHNVAGQLTESGHVQRGWLAPTVSGDDTQMSETTAAQLNENGFVGSGYFQHEICSG